MNDEQKMGFMEKECVEFESERSGVGTSNAGGARAQKDPRKHAASWQRCAGQAETEIKRGILSFAGMSAPETHQAEVPLHVVAALHWLSMQDG